MIYLWLLNVYRSVSQNPDFFHSPIHRARICPFKHAYEGARSFWARVAFGPPTIPQRTIAWTNSILFAAAVGVNFAYYVTSPIHDHNPIYEWTCSKHTSHMPPCAQRNFPSKQACDSRSPRTKIDIEFHFLIFYMNYERYILTIHILTDTAQVSIFQLLLAFMSKSCEIASVSHCVRESF